MKTMYKSVLLTAAILTLTVLTAQCALIGDEVQAIEPTRITAPCAVVCADEHERVKDEPSSTAGAVPLPPREGKGSDENDVAENIPSVQAEAPYVDAFELMYDTPLRAVVQFEIEQMCTARDVDAAVALAIIYHESRYVENKIGDAERSFGLMQILRECHEERMARLGVQNLLDGVQNVRVGVDILDELLDKYGGDYLKALTAYRTGHYSGEIDAYAYKVMEEAVRICSE